MDNRLTSKSSLRNSFHKNRVGGVGKDRSANLYGNFFEGYIEEYAPRKSGKGKRIVRTYVGKYYSPDETHRKFWVTKVLYVLLSLIGFGLFVSSLIRPEIPFTALLVVPQAAALCVMLWSFVAYGAFLPAGVKMTIGEYKRSSPALISSSKWLAICYLACALCAVLHVLLFSSEHAAVLLWSALRLLIAAAFPFAIFRMEREQTYHEVYNPNSKLIEKSAQEQADT